MNISQISRILGLTLSLGLLTPMFASAADSSETPPSWLFVQDASRGTLTGTNDQDLTLTLKGLPPYTSAFVDRPFKAAAAIPNQKFFNDWNRLFANSPPNATLAYTRPGNSRPMNIVLTLTSPSFDAGKNVITYKAAVLYRTLATDVPGAPGYSIPIPKSFGEASLFIDSSSLFPTFPECANGPKACRDAVKQFCSIPSNAIYCGAYYGYY